MWISHVCNLMWTFTLKLSLWGLSALLTWCSIFIFYCWIVNDIQKLKTMWSALLYFATYTCTTERPQSLESQCAIVTQIPIGPWILYHSWCVSIQLHIGGSIDMPPPTFEIHFFVLLQTVWPAQCFVTNLASQGK